MSNPLRLHIQENWEKSIFILREAHSQFKNLCCLWSTGKDSTTSIGLGLDAFFGKLPYPVVHLDTGFKFQEIYKFRDETADKLGFELIVAKSEDHYGKMKPENGKIVCCTSLKTETLKQVVREYGFDGVIVSIRRDEHGIRNKERYFSPRDREFRWKVLEEKPTEDEGDSPFKSLQDVEMSGWGLFESDFGPNADHIRIHPILHWDEDEVWMYMQDRGLPVNPLYYAKGGWRYRSLGCWPCTEPIKSNAITIEEFIKEIQADREGERAGRSQDKEESHAMQKLRALGYM